MKKVTSVQPGAVINFRVSGNKGGGGPDDKSPGGSGSVFVIDNKGCLVDEGFIPMLEERLGGQIAIRDAKKEDLPPVPAAPKAEVTVAPQTQTPVVGDIIN